MKTRFEAVTRRPAFFLNRLIKSGVSADAIAIDDGKITFSVPFSQAACVESLLLSEGMEYRTSGYLGVKRTFRRLAKRPFLCVAAVLAICGVLFFESFVYDYSVKGNRYVNTEEVAAILRENKVDGFTAKRSLDLSAIKREIVALDGVSFASVKIVGNRLEVEIQEELPRVSPETPQYDSILSSADAVVTRVVAESGTPRVKTGDVVKKGDALIDAFHDFTEGGTPAPARGEVWGRVTYQKEIVIPAFRVESVLTGDTERMREVTFFGKKLGVTPPTSFTDYEGEESILFVGFGVTVTEKVYRKREDRITYIDFEQEGAALVEKAIVDLLLSVPFLAAERSAITVRQKNVDNIFTIVLYYTVEQRIDSLVLVP